MTVYTYAPPLVRMIHRFPGSWALTYGIRTGTITYRVNGSWFNVENAGVGELDGADLVFTVPTVVSVEVAGELQSFGVGTVTTQ